MIMLDIHKSTVDCENVSFSSGKIWSVEYFCYGLKWEEEKLRQIQCLQDIYKFTKFLYAYDVIYITFFFIFFIHRP